MLQSCASLSQPTDDRRPSLPFLRVPDQSVACCGGLHRPIKSQIQPKPLPRKNPNEQQNCSPEQRCGELCNRTASCFYFTHVKSNAGGSHNDGVCMLCEKCVLRRMRRSASWARVQPSWPAPTLAATPPHVVTGALVPLLQDKYSEQLYGSRNRVPTPGSLRIVWAQLLNAAALAHLAGPGICRFSPAAPLHPYFAPIDLDAANPHGALWLHSEQEPQPAASHSWVEVTHCAQQGDITEATEAKCAALQAMGRNHTRPPIKHWKLAFQCMHMAGKRGSWAWRFGTMWLYVAPGSGVSINVGRTKVFREYAPAEAFLRRALREEPLERARSSRCDVLPAVVNESRGLATGLDSIQVLRHHEYFSTEPRYELIMLRHAECESLATASSASLDLRCGRHPHLTACTNGSAALQRVSTCATGVASIHESVRGFLSRECKTPAMQARCLRNGSQYACAQPLAGAAPS